MPWPSWWVWVGGFAPWKLWWLGWNRLATWTGLFLFWRRFRSHRFVWLWLLLLNTVSVGALIVLLMWLKRRSLGGAP